MHKNQQENHAFRPGSTRAFITAFLLLVSAFFSPFLTHRFYAYFIFQICFFMVIVIIMYLSRAHTRFLLFETCFLVPYIIFNFISLHQHSLTYMAIAYGFSAAFLLLGICLLTKKILYAPVINTNLLFGALLVYLMAGILWSKFYFIENIIFPGSFQSAEKLDFYRDFLEAILWQFNLIYYSFSVITTLGVGDITPLGGQAKSFTIFEAMFGQFFVAIIIAKLVSAWRQKATFEHYSNADDEKSM